MLLIALVGFPEIELQDTVVLKTDTVTKAISKPILPVANTDSIEAKKDTSQIPVSEGSSVRNGFSQDSYATESNVLTQSQIHNLTGKNDIPYYLPDTFDFYQVRNPLGYFNEQYFSIKETSELIYKGESKSSGKVTSSESVQIQDQNPVMQQDIKPDWIIAIIIGSLVILAWLKLFFNKFFDQVVVSMWNFQLGSKFLRDQGIFSRRVGFVLNINFLLVFGLFIYLSLTNFNINPLSLKPFPAYLLYTTILTALLLIRYILTSLAGHIFNQQAYFREYLYHLLIIYKNMGIIFIPIDFCIAYIQENLRIYFIIFALVLVVLAYIYRFVKGFQLIIKKDALIFYLILYLCTLEIIPVLFYYKFFSGWIK